MENGEQKMNVDEENSFFFFEIIQMTWMILTEKKGKTYRIQKYHQMLTPEMIQSSSVHQSQFHQFSNHRDKRSELS